MNLPLAVLKKGEGRTLKAGGAWIFDNEIDSVTGAFENGDVVMVHDFDGYPMGRGFINMHSKIRIRMLTRNPDQEIDEEFFRDTPAGCLGVPEKDGGHRKLPDRLRRGGFPSGAGGGQVFGRARRSSVWLLGWTGTRKSCALYAEGAPGRGRR